MPRFGTLLKTLRAAAGLTQEELAERAGLSVRGLQDLEGGRSQKPHRETAELLAAALELSGRERARFLAVARGHRDRSGDRAVETVPSPHFRGALVPLIGRAPELTLLEHFLDGGNDRPGSVPVLFLAGEPGIGKTRLLQAAAQHAIARGWTVMVGGCHRRGGQDPYAPVLDALAQHLRAEGPARRRGALAGCGWLVRLLPELAPELEAVPLGTLEPDQERRLMVAAVARVLSNAAGPAGTLLVLDDLQWAGADALYLLITLLRADSPLRIVGAYRDTEIRSSDPLGVFIADLAQAGQIHQETLGPLAPDEAANLLDNLMVDLPDGNRSFVESALQRAGGTPFYLISYAQALRQGGTSAVPWDLAQGIRQRVALLPPGGPEVLAAAAVVGRRAPRALLTAVVGLHEESVVDALEAAGRARLLLEAGDGAYAFAHDLIREVVEADLSAARRSALHRRVAEEMERASSPTSLDTLAYHWMRAGLSDRAAISLEEAGDQAYARYAHAGAERSYRAAAGLLEQMGQGPALVRVQEKLGAVLYQAGRHAEALLVLGQAADAYRSTGDLEGEVRVTAAVAQAHTMSGAPNVGIDRITALLARIEAAGDSPAPPSLQGMVGKLLLITGRYPEAAAAIQRAAEMAAERGDDRTSVLADYDWMHVLFKLGKIEDAMQLASEVLQRAEELGDLRMLAGMHRDLAFNLTAQGELGSAGIHVDRARVVARQAEAPGEIMISLAIRGWLAFVRGEWERARADLDRAVALSGGNDWLWLSAYPLLFRAHLLLAEGDWPAAARAGQEALSLAARAGDLQGIRWTSAVLAELDILQGKAEAAIERLVTLLDRPGLMESDVTDFLPVLAWAHLESGQLDRAGEVAATALSRARAENAKLVLTEALRVRAMLALRQGELHAAAESLAEGLALTQSMPYPYGEARLAPLIALLHEEQEAARPRPTHGCP